MNIRQKAASLLSLWEKEDGFANLMLTDDILQEAKDEAGTLTALFYGAVERKLSLDYAIGALSGRALSDISSHTKQLLRLGLYQIYFMRIPPYAVVNETVALGENKAEKGFLNAILRRALRQGEMPLPPKDKKIRFLSVKESFPQETVKRFASLFGYEKTEELLAFFNRVLPTTVRVTKGSREEYISLLAKEGIEAEKTAFAPMGVRVLTPSAVSSLPLFAEGGFFVQDEASQIATVALDAKKGQRVIDVCACPGGKTAGALADMKGEGEAFAFDLHESKLSLVSANLKRLGFSASVAALDAKEGNPSLFETADRVICDVPCSGLGVLGKKPDLRYREISAELPSLQYDILCASCRYVKRGGVLVYSTCTLLPEENQENVARFLEEHKDFEAEDFAVGSLKSEKGQLTLLPFLHETDGFFVAKLHRKGNT